MNFFYKNKLFINLVKKIQLCSNRFLQKVDVVKEIVFQNQWDKKFIGCVYLDYKLNDRVKIRLYKESVLSQLIYKGFEIEECGYLKSVLKEGDYFVDVGANIGLFSLIASDLVGQSGKVISFEPTPEIFRRFNENIQINQFTNIDSFNIGLSNLPGSLAFNISNNGFDAWNSFAIPNNLNIDSKIQVNVSTLDIELSKFDKSKIRIIKMDVEGWEKFVLKGGIEFFTNYNPEVMVEFTEANTFAAGYMIQEIYDFMVGLGYQWYKIENHKLIKSEKKIHYPYENLIAKKIK